MDTGAARISWNPYSRNYFIDPYTHLRQCRISAAVQPILNDTAYMLFKHEHVSSILRDTNYQVNSLSAFFTEKEELIFRQSTQCPHLARATAKWPMYLNGQDHKDIRKAMAIAFTQSNYETVIEGACIRTIEFYSGLECFDLTDFCSTYISYIVRNLLHLDDKTSDQELKYFSNLLARSQDLYLSRQDYLQINEAIEQHKDLFKKSVFLDQIKNSLACSDSELYSVMLISFMAAYETSKDNLCVALYELMRSGQGHAWMQQKESLNTGIEELFRYSSPLQYTVRVSSEDIEFQGYRIPSQSKLYLSLASANRDELVFSNPDQLDFHREFNPHVSFGGGIHLCIGATIARQELRVGLPMFMPFLNRYKLDAEKPARWAKQIFMRNLDSAPVYIQKG